ncbi:MAG: ABC transporter permease [Gemmatimonadota bacterium]
MHKLLAVIRREYVERVRSRAFVIGTVLGPVLMALLFVLPIILAGRGTEAKRVAVVDGASGEFGRRVAAALEAARRGRGPDATPRYLPVLVPAHGRVEAVRDSLVTLTGLPRKQGPSFDGLLLLTDEALDSGKLQYLGANVGSPGDMRLLETTLQPVVLAERLQRTGVDPATVMKAVGPLELETTKITQGKVTGESGEASFWLAYAMGFILYLALVLYGVQVMSSIVEEKSNRIIEVLASSLTPFQLMLGKILGVGAVGLTQLTIWGGTAALLSGFSASLMQLVGASPDAVGAMRLPAVSPALLAVFLTFFLLGFFLYAAAYAAVGAMCNSTQETQQANTPVTMCIVFGFILTFSLLNDPNGQLARTLTMVPLVSPFVVPLRYSLSPLPLGELLLAMAIAAVAVLAVAWVAARIYRVGILAYGKKPTLKQLARWVATG